MTCCGGDMAAQAARSDGDGIAAAAEALLHAGRTMPDGSVQYVVSSADIHCGQCIIAIEKRFRTMAGVRNARVNLSLRRITFIVDPDQIGPDTVLEELHKLGYVATPVDIGELEDVNRKRKDTALLRALAVAGFASSNIMLLSVSVWSGADGATRDLFHLISALIAIPAVIYAGMVYFKSAFAVLKRGMVNMDVPISLAITLATAMSLFEALNGGEHAYFEASTMLLFFLLIGRYLDQRMRERVRTAVVQLNRLAARGADVVADDGTVQYRPLDEIEPGMRVRLQPGDRLPADAIVISGKSDLDRSLVSGESMPVPSEIGVELESGVLNMTGTLDVKIVKSPQHSFLAEVQAMMDAAENGRGRYVRIADRAARAYAPFVHSAAALAFVGWMIWTGGDWHTSLYVAIALLIITCPCALGLAVPVVHVIGASRLFEEGILMKDGAALEKLAEIDHIVLDKTGTLTTGTPTVTSCAISQPDEVGVAAALAGASRHPASRAIAQFFRHAVADKGTDIREHPGDGVEGMFRGKRARLGRAQWVDEIAAPATTQGSALSFAFEGMPPRSITLGEIVRHGAADLMGHADRNGITMEIVSGDAPEPVARLAEKLGIPQWQADQRPADKIARIAALAAQGKRVMMVGDGINDAPALAAGHVSMAPASGSDVGRTAADFVFTRDSLAALPFAHDIAMRAQKLVQQNFALAALYNVIAIPIAVAGHVTPLVAALAMSASSIIVVANSMRLTRRTARPQIAIRPTLGQSSAGAMMEPAE